jgi:asparagine synthase (glutamine-hydrolysing)
MCGIAGLLRLDGTAPDPAVLGAMAAALDHRGPDGEGAHLDGPVALASRRLALVDVPGGDQPLRSEDGTIVAVCNGEIYNWRELREELHHGGHAFATRSDCEVLVHLYEEHGPRLVTRLRGMWALALWDARRGRLVLARDPFGIKPLVYARDGAELGFASELKGLLAGGLARDLDPGALGELLTSNAISAPRTIFAGARKLEPGCVLVAEARSGAVRVERVERPAPAPSAAVRGGGLRALAGELRERLEGSVAAHLRADVPVGVLLSGGLDSGLIAALAARHAGPGLPAFTVGFGERSFDELALARRVARGLGLEHHEVHVGAEDAAAHLRDVAETFDEPRGDATALPYWLAARAAGGRVKAVLSGEGADELLAGYQTYVADLLPQGVARGAAALEPVLRRIPSSSRRLSLDFRLRRLALGPGCRRSSATTRGRRSSPRTPAPRCSRPRTPRPATRSRPTGAGGPRRPAPRCSRACRTSTWGPSWPTTSSPRPTGRRWRTASRSASPTWTGRWRRSRSPCRPARRSAACGRRRSCARRPAGSCRGRSPRAQARLRRPGRRVAAGPPGALGARAAVRGPPACAGAAAPGARPRAPGPPRRPPGGPLAADLDAHGADPLARAVERRRAGFRCAARPVSVLRRMRRLLALATCVLLGAVLAAAPAAQAQDSLAPEGAEPHWLPDEEWVNLLWLPFDEEDLYRLLRTDRGAVFRWVRIDADNSLAQIANRKGWKVDALARRLAAERSGGASARTRRIVASRARRVLTQPHLSQHLLFHALHQTAIGEDAPRIFGVRRSEDFFDLRRAEVSPLQIGELHGRTRVTMTRRCVEVLRAAASRAVRSGAMSRLQADILLDRQLRQIPRWLGQNRYNGPTGGRNRPKAPPPTTPPPRAQRGRDEARVGRLRTTISEAEQLGEIHVAGWDLGAARAFGASPPEERGSRRPTSYYNSVLSADGTTVAFESAESTYPLAKRVGQMTILVRDLRTGRLERVSHVGRPKGARGSRTAFNPTLSADGRLVAFEATDAGTPSRNGVWLYDRATRTQRLVEEERAGAAYLRSSRATARPSPTPRPTTPTAPRSTSSASRAAPGRWRRSRRTAARPPRATPSIPRSPTTARSWPSSRARRTSPEPTAARTCTCATWPGPPRCASRGPSPATPWTRRSPPTGGT